MTSQGPTNPCTNCGSEVASRRPSKTGTHWCPKPECVAAKQRFYYRHRSAAEQERLQRRQNQIDRFDLFGLMVAGIDRTPCQSCGRTDAIPGWVHPAPGWTAACTALGERGRSIGEDWIATVWPKP